MDNSDEATARNLPRIRILILNWNGLEDTIECVSSVRASTESRFELWIIDNGSDGDDADRLRAQFAGDSRIEIHRNETNLGFTKGMNVAMAQALDDGVELVVLLNNDTSVARDWLQRLVEEAHRTGAGIVASRMMNYFDTDRIDNAGHSWLNTGEILPRGTGEKADAYLEAADLVGGCAGAILFRASLLREVGLFDPYFSTGYEDAEHGLRAFLAGFPTRYCPQAVVHHKVSQSIDKVRDFRYSVGIQKNINYTIIKLMPAGALMLNGPFIALKTVMVPLIALLFGRWTLCKAHLMALGATARDRQAALEARRNASPQRRTGLREILGAQHFFLRTYLGYFTRYFMTGKKTVFER